MGHDLDDEELKATKNNFYYLDIIKENLDEMKVIIKKDLWFEIDTERTEEFYNAINELFKRYRKNLNNKSNKIDNIKIRKALNKIYVYESDALLYADDKLLEILQDLEKTLKGDDKDE